MYRLGFYVSNRRFPNKRKYLFELYGRKLWSLPCFLLLPWAPWSELVCIQPLTRVAYFLIGYMLLPIWIICTIQLIKVPEQRYYFFKIPMWLVFIGYLCLNSVLCIIIYYWQIHDIGAYYWDMAV